MEKTLWLAVTAFFVIQFAIGFKISSKEKQVSNFISVPFKGEKLQNDLEMPLEDTTKRGTDILKILAPENFQQKIGWMENSLLPDGNANFPDDNSYKKEYITLSILPRRLLQKSKKMTTSTNDYLSVKTSATIHLKEKMRQRRSADDSSQWSDFGCCRRAIGIQTRQRRVDSLYLQIQTRQCGWDYCEDCLDSLRICNGFRDTQGACNEDSQYVGFMSQNCPEACGWCTEVTASSAPPTQSIASTSILTTTTSTIAPVKTALPTRDPVLRLVRVFMNDANSIHTYKFTTTLTRPTFPWKPVARSLNPGESASFYLYARPTGRFRMGVFFCVAGTVPAQQKWLVSKRPCRGKWRNDMTLYASDIPIQNTRRLLVANRGRFPWTSRIFRNTSPCCGYEKSVWSFYAPVIRPTGKPIKPTTSSRPPTSISKQTTQPSQTIKPTLKPSTVPKSSFHRECLEYHNFFRAIHGVPPLKWDNTLSETAQKWADYLVANAPEHPYITKPGVRRTPNWPHSQSNTQYRSRGVGENIAWDFSPSGSPAKESVLRWYAEIFDYNKANPTFSATGKPVGHYTQLLWENSRQLGCAVAVRRVRKDSWTYQSTYTIAHYGPGGNVHYGSKRETDAAYNRNVPVPVNGTCMSAEGCSVHNNEKNRCMGFDENMQCSCSTDNTSVFGGRPQCKGTGGCIVSCKRPPATNKRITYNWKSECQGERSCECVYVPRRGQAGAICS